MTVSFAPGMEKERSKGRMITGLIGLALGIATMAYAVKLGVGTLAAPAPGTWPFISGLIILPASIAVTLSKAEPDEEEQFTHDSWGVLWAILSMVGFLILFSWIGFTIPAFLLVAGWLRLFAGARWITTIAGALACALIMKFLFVNLLGVPFPPELIMLGGS